MAVLCGCGRYFSKPHGRLAWFISWTTLWKYIFCSLWIWFWLKLPQDHNQQHKSMNNQSRERSNNNHIKTCWYCAWSIGGALIVVEVMPYTFFCWLSENSIIGSVTSREWVYLRSVVFELCLEFSCLQRERSTAEKEGWCSGCRVAEQLALLADTQSDSTEAHTCPEWRTYRHQSTQIHHDLLLCTTTPVGGATTVVGPPTSSVF